MTLEASASRGWVNAVIATAGRLFVSADDLLVAANMPMETCEHERWPIDDLTRLWYAAAHCTGDSSFGLKVGAEFTPMSINGVGFALQSAATLREAMEIVQRFQRLISDGGRFQMLANDSNTWLIYHPCQEKLAFSPHQIEAVLAAVVGFAGWIGGGNVQPLLVQFSHARLGSLQNYRAALHCQIEFEKAFNGVLVDNSILDRPLHLVDPQLAQFHKLYAKARLTALSMSSAALPEIRQWVAARLGPVLPRRAEVAEALGISERTLARRLREQKQTFEGLLDEVRRERALQAVAEASTSLLEIAESLGFAEASTFYRAFKRWTSLPPARWRKQKLNS